jgi:uncharacterized membrane protein
MMFGLALTTVAAYTVFDAGVFARRESAEYQRWAVGFALKLYTVGLIWFAVMGLWYLSTWPVRDQMLSSPLIILTALTALGPGLPWLLILAQRRQVTQVTRHFDGIWRSLVSWRSMRSAVRCCRTLS